MMHMLKVKGKRMRRSKPRAGSKEDTPTILCLRDREVTRRHVTLPKPSARKQMHQQPGLSNRQRHEESDGRQQVLSEEESDPRYPPKDIAATRGVPARARGDLTDQESRADSRDNGPRGPQPLPMVNDNKRGRARLREAVMAMTPKRRVRTALPRRSTTSEVPFGTLQHAPLNLGQLEPGDTPQGKRTKIVSVPVPVLVSAPMPVPVPVPVPEPVPIPMIATVCLEAQKSRLMQWKRHGLQLLNCYDQYTKTQDVVVRRTWSTTATAYFKRKTHNYIKWVNKEHGMMWYQFRKLTHQWLQEAEAAVAAMRTTTVMQANKRLRDTPRKTPAKKLKPVYSRPQDVLLHDDDATLDVERPRWVPPAEDDSGCDHEMMLRHGADAIPNEERPGWAPPAEDNSDCDYEVMLQQSADTTLDVERPRWVATK